MESKNNNKYDNLMNMSIPEITIFKKTNGIYYIKTWVNFVDTEFVFVGAIIYYRYNNAVVEDEEINPNTKDIKKINRHDQDLNEKEYDITRFEIFLNILMDSATNYVAKENTEQ